MQLNSNSTAPWSHFSSKNSLRNKQATCLAKTWRSRFWTSDRLLKNVVSSIHLQSYVSLTTQKLSNKSGSEKYMKYLVKWGYRYIWWIWSEHCTNRKKWCREHATANHWSVNWDGSVSCDPNYQNLCRVHNETISWRFKKRYSDRRKWNLQPPVFWWYYHSSR